MCDCGREEIDGEAMQDDAVFMSVHCAENSSGQNREYNCAGDESSLKALGSIFVRGIETRFQGADRGHD